MASADTTENMIRIGTRGSQLALAQANEVRDRLIAAHETDLQVEIEVISTKGDRVLDRPLSEIGGKGLFTEEIEERLADGRIDIAVHSTKDMPTALPDGLKLSCYLPREAAQDAFISNNYENVDELPEGAVVGSSSLRRKALLLRMRPDLKVVNFRGNVQTRLKKLEEGQVDATLLAVAGLNRLGMQDIIRSTMDEKSFPPAPGQGAICIESRTGDERISNLLAPIHDHVTAVRLEAERAFLRELDGSCRTPLAGYAEFDNDMLLFHGLILKPDGTESHDVHLAGHWQNAESLGKEAAMRLREQAGDGFFDDWT